MTAVEMKISFPIKIALLVFFITGSSVAGLSLLSYHYAGSMLREVSLQEVAQELRREATQLANNLQTLREDAFFLAGSNEVSGVIRAIQGEGYDSRENMTTELWKGRIDRIFTSVLRQRRGYAKVRLIGVRDGGLEIVRVERRGQQIFSGHTVPLQKKGDQPYFQRIIRLAKGQFYISDINLNQERGRIVYPHEPTIRLGLPVFDSEDKIFAALVIDADFDVIAHALKTTRKDLYYFVTNEKGDYLFHPDRGKRFAFEFGEEKRVQDDFPGIGLSCRQGEDRASLGGDPLFDLASLRIMQTSQAGLVTQHYHFDPLHTERYIVLGAVASHEMIVKKAEIFRDTLLLLFFLVTLTGAVVMAVTVRWFTRPIRELTCAANQIKGGEGDVEIVARSQDEIGDLALAFRAMLERLASSNLEVRALAESLEDQVAERTRELSEARQRAEASMQAKSAFLATMSHEIRTPMNGVLGMMDLLLGTELSMRQRRYAETVYRSGESLLTILSDILDLSKIEAGQVELEMTRFDLREVLEGVSNLFVPQAQEKLLELTVRIIPPHMPTAVIGDPIRLRQTLVNLVGNGIKFTKQGGVRLSAVLQSETSTTLFLRFEVQDSGIGIALEEQEQLFQPFMQADSSSTRKFGGSGLGLSIVKRLVGLMQGRLGLESEPDKGSTFWVELYLDKQASQPHPAALQPVEYAGGQVKFKVPDFSGRWLLIVDGSEVNCEILKDQASLLGLRAEVASGSEPALAALAQSVRSGPRYELAILDYMMPKVDGLQLATQMAESSDFRGIPVMILTSIQNIASIEKRKPGNVVQILTKPVRQAQLLRSIHDIFSSTQCSLMEGKTPEEKKWQPRFEEKAAQPTFADVRVLVAEDFEINREVLLEMLANLGCAADWAGTGEEAVAMARSQTYDLILMDLHMPEMDGLQATAVIRERERGVRVNARIPIVAVTADAMEGDREKCLSAGMNDYLAKPYRSEDLVRIIERWVVFERKNGLPRPGGASHADPDFRAQDCVRLSQSGAGESHPDVASFVRKETLEQLRQDMGGNIEGLLKKFLQKLPDRVQAIVDAVERGDSVAIVEEAHRLKGGSRTIGAEQMADLCHRLEETPSEASALVAELRSVSCHVKNALKLLLP